MEASRFVLAQCAVLGIALGAGDPPPLPSYNFGTTGEATKVDTAFGNLGEIGSVYNVPEARNDSTVTSGGNLKVGNTDEPIKQTNGPPEIVESTTTEVTEKFSSSNEEDLTTVKPTDLEEITLAGSESEMNDTAGMKGPLETSTVSNPTQTYDTTTISKEQPTTAGSGNNITFNSSNTNVTAEATKSPEGPSNPNTQSSPFSNPSTTPSNKWTQGSTLQTTPDGPPSQTFHTGSPNSTDAPTIIPPSSGHNETKPGQNATLSSKPNSSQPIYLNNGNMCLTLAVISFYYMIKL